MPAFLLGFCLPIDIKDPRPHFSLLKSLGYDGIELWDQTLPLLPIDAWAELFEDTGIACAQLCPYFNFIHGQEMWDESLRIAERYIDWAVRLGNPLIRVFTGIPWGEGVVSLADTTPAQWAAAVNGLQRVCDMGAPHGIRFALECHMGSLMENSASTSRLLALVNRPNLGVNLQLPLDGGHEPIDVSVEKLGGHTWHMHTHNYSSLIDGKQVPLAEGVIDYPAILPRLMAAGFHGYVSIEHPTFNGDRDPWLTAREEAAYLLALRERLAE